MELGIYRSSLVGLTAIVIVVCFSHTHHSASEPGAAASSDEESDIRLGRACSRKSPKVASEPGVAPSAQGHQWGIYQRGVHARRVTYQGTFNAVDAVRRSDGVSGREHQAINRKAQVASRQVHFRTATRRVPCQD